MVQTQHTNAFETTLRVDFGPTALTAEVQSTDGSPASPCYLVIEPTNADRREYVLFDGTFTADQFVTSSTANRYLMPGSAATSGITHPAGSIVRFSPVAQHFTDHFTDVDARFATKAAKAGDTFTGDIVFNKTLGASNRLLDLQQSYGLYSDNTGPGAANSRLWVNGPDGGAVYIGPRGGGDHLGYLALRADDVEIAATSGTAKVARVVKLTYAGNGTTDRLITLPFEPAFVVISWITTSLGWWTAQSGAALGSGVRGLKVNDQGVSTASSNEDRPELVGGATPGFRVSGTANTRLNASGVTYHYRAFG